MLRRAHNAIRHNWHYNRLAVIACASLALPAAALASSAEPASLSEIQTSSFGRAVQATVQAHLERRGASFDHILQMNNMMGARVNRFGMQEYSAPQNWIEVINRFARVGKWFPLRPFDGFALPIPVGACFGSYCRKENAYFPSSGSGVPGDRRCEDLLFEETVATNTIKVPSLPMVGSGPITKFQPIWSAGTQVRGLEHADSPIAAALWAYHTSNIGLPRERWRGAWKWDSPGQDGSTFVSSWPSYRDPVTGFFHPANIHGVTVKLHPYPWQPYATSKPCPEGAGGSDDFDFYMGSKNPNGWDELDQCTWYAKNYDLSPTGYGYPKTVEINQWEASQVFESQPNFATCQVSLQLIRLVSDRVFNILTKENDWGGPAYAAIEPGDVRVAGSVPRGVSLLDNPGNSLPQGTPPTVATPVYAPPPPNYTPPPPPPGTGGGGNPDGDGDGTGNESPGGSVDLSHPDIDEPGFEAPDITMPDWFPDWASFVMPEAQGECPVFGFEGFGQTFSMDTHCHYVEQNRATISSIMLIVFAFSAYAIIMRA